MRKGFLALVFLASCLLLVAQQALDNDAVIRLVKAGLSNELIVSTVKAQAGTYDTTTEGLIALKTAGVSDSIVEAIVEKASLGAPVSAVPATATMAVNLDDPAAPHEAGIYAYSGKAPNKRLTMLEPLIYNESKTGGALTSAMTYGIAKEKVKAVVRNAHSNVRITDPDVVFYFYFELQGAGLSKASSYYIETSTPNEYTLLRFNVKKDTRETIVSKFSAYGGSSGTDDKATVAFNYTRLRPGVYKVTPRASLLAGEYGFFSPMGVISPYAAAATASSRIFDFGIE